MKVLVWPTWPDVVLIRGGQVACCGPSRHQIAFIAGYERGEAQPSGHKQSSIACMTGRGTRVRQRDRQRGMRRYRLGQYDCWDARTLQNLYRIWMNRNTFPGLGRQTLSPLIIQGKILKISLDVGCIIGKDEEKSILCRCYKAFLRVSSCIWYLLSM